MDLQHPAVQSGLFPLAVSFALAGVLRLAGGRDAGARLASAAVGFTLVGALVLVLGVPPFPPRTAAQKLPYLVAGGTLLGILLDARGPSRSPAVLLALALPVVVVGWLAWGRLAAPTVENLVPAGAVLAAGVVAALRLARWRGSETTAPVMLLVAALGLAGVAAQSASISIAQLVGALAAALGGFLLWNWPVARYPFGWAGLLGGAGGLLALATQTTLFTAASPVALGLLALVFLADLALDPRRLDASAWRRALAPVLLALICALPAAAAVAVAFFTGRSGSPYLP